MCNYHLQTEPGLVILYVKGQQHVHILTSLVPSTTSLGITIVEVDTLGCPDFRDLGLTTLPYPAPRKPHFLCAWLQHYLTKPPSPPFSEDEDHSDPPDNRHSSDASEGDWD